MTIYPAFSCHQPSATLIATPLPLSEMERHHPGHVTDGLRHAGCPRCREHPPMVKRFETRSRPCPPKYIGQRVAIHAAKGERWRHSTMLGDFRLYRADGAGVVHRPRQPARMYRRDVGWATRPETAIALPLGAVVATAVITASLPISNETGTDRIAPEMHGTELTRYRMTAPGLSRYEDISDQLPYGDWTPGRFAWALADVEPLEVPVPWKGRQGWFTVELP